MKTKLIALTLLLSTHAFAAEQTISCSNKKGNLSVSITKSSNGDSAAVFGLGSAIADQFGPAKINFTRSDKGAISASASMKGVALQIAVSGERFHYCSGCGGGASYDYRHTKVRVTNAAGSVTKVNLSCSFEEFND